MQSQDREFLARVGLALSPGIGPARFHRLFRAFGSALAAYGAEAPERERACGMSFRPEESRALDAGPDLGAVERQLELARRQGVALLTWSDPDFPAPLKALPHPPPLLFVRGAWLPDDSRSLAVVGTRYPSRYGVEVTGEFGRGLAQRGLAVVSGLARGVDAAAHRAALAGGGRTVAVVGHGLDYAYPRENLDLYQSIPDHGAVISEFPFGMAPLPGNFPRRNRLLSALALGTLVTEAGTGSGALITARFALEQGKEIFAVPGDIRSPHSRGSHWLIQQGAHLVQGPEEAVEILGGLNNAVPARRLHETHAQARPDPAGEDPEPPALPPLWAALPPEEGELLARLRRGPAHLEALGEACDEPSHRLLPRLLRLEIRGLVRRRPDSSFSLA